MSVWTDDDNGKEYHAIVYNVLDVDSEQEHGVFDWIRFKNKMYKTLNKACEAFDASKDVSDSFAHMNMAGFINSLVSLAAVFTHAPDVAVKQAPSFSEVHIEDNANADALREAALLLDAVADGQIPDFTYKDVMIQVDDGRIVLFDSENVYALYNGVAKRMYTIGAEREDFYENLVQAYTKGELTGRENLEDLQIAAEKEGDKQMVREISRELNARDVER